MGASLHYPDRGIVCTYIHSDGISTILDDHNTLTRQYADTNNAHWDPLNGPDTHAEKYRGQQGAKK